MSSIRYILVASSVEYPIANEVAKTFNDEVLCKIVRLCDTVVTNYSSSKQISAVENEMEQSFRRWLKEYREVGGEVYLLLSGSTFNVSEAVKLLERNGVEYKRLIYEKKIDKYAIIE